jgi:hypothetical protein
LICSDEQRLLELICSDEQSAGIAGWKKHSLTAVFDDNGSGNDTIPESLFIE